MTEGAAFRGQPLLVLGALLIGWTALRAMIWQPLPPQPRLPVRLAGAERPEPLESPARSGADRAGPLVAVASDWRSAPLFLGSAPTRTPDGVTPPRLALTPLESQFDEPTMLALSASTGVSQSAPVAPWTASRRVSRWSADGWLLLRRDSATPFLSGRQGYGRSQAGAVVRYELAQTSSHRPQAHLRASTALAGAREHEVAAGLSARPVGELPVRVAVEARLGETDRGTRTRPAVYAVTELSPLPLPFGMRAEVYAQGGYVGGAYATPFVDGQARVGRPLAMLRGVQLGADVGVWGGSQREASRLDVGPSVTVSFRLGKANGRVSADYRFRVAGNAQPASGPALTVSAGF